MAKEVPSPPALEPAFILSQMRLLLPAEPAPEEEERMVDAACFLWDLSMSSEGAAYIVAQGAVPILLRLIHQRASHTERLLETCLGTLANLLSSAGVCDALAARGAWAVLCDVLMTSSNSSVLLELMRCLSVALSTLAVAPLDPTRVVYTRNWIGELCAPAPLSQLLQIVENTMRREVLLTGLGLVSAISYIVDILPSFENGPDPHLHLSVATMPEAFASTLLEARALPVVCDLLVEHWRDGELCHALLLPLEEMLSALASESEVPTEEATPLADSRASGEGTAGEGTSHSPEAGWTEAGSTKAGSTKAAWAEAGCAEADSAEAGWAEAVSAEAGSAEENQQSLTQHSLSAVGMSARHRVWQVLSKIVDHADEMPIEAAAIACALVAVIALVYSRMALLTPPSPVAILKLIGMLEAQLEPELACGGENFSPRCAVLCEGVRAAWSLLHACCLTLDGFEISLAGIGSTGSKSTSPDCVTAPNRDEGSCSAKSSISSFDMLLRRASTLCRSVRWTHRHPEVGVVRMAEAVLQLLHTAGDAVATTSPGRDGGLILEGFNTISRHLSILKDGSEVAINSFTVEDVLEQQEEAGGWSDGSDLSWADDAWHEEGGLSPQDEDWLDGEGRLQDDQEATSTTISHTRADGDACIGGAKHIPNNALFCPPLSGGVCVEGLSDHKHSEAAAP